MAEKSVIFKLANGEKKFKYQLTKKKKKNMDKQQLFNLHEAATQQESLVSRCSNSHAEASKFSFQMEIFSPELQIKASRLSRPPRGDSGSFEFVIVSRCIIIADTGC